MYGFVRDPRPAVVFVFSCNSTWKPHTSAASSPITNCCFTQLQYPFPFLLSLYLPFAFVP